MKYMIIALALIAGNANAYREVCHTDGSGAKICQDERGHRVSRCHTDGAGREICEYDD